MDGIRSEQVDAFSSVCPDAFIRIRTEGVSGGKIEITLPDGTSVKVGHDVGLATLRRVMTVLRR